MLRAGGAAATALTASLAGCQRLGDLLGGDGGDHAGSSSLTFPSVADPWYRPWVPTPESAGGLTTRVLHVDLGRIRAVEDAVPPVFSERMRTAARRTRDYLGVPTADVSRVAWVGGETVVLFGDFSAADVGGSVTESGYERAGSVADHALFTRTDAPRAVAAADGSLVWSAEDGDPRRVVAAAVRAGRDATSRLADQRDRFHELAGILGCGLIGTLTARNMTFSLGQGEEIEDLTALGRTSVVADGGLYTRLVVRYAGEETPAYGHGRLLPADEYEAVDLRADGSTVTVTGRRPVGSVSPEETAAPTALPPLVTWSFDVGPDAVTVTHAAGESVPATELSLYDQSFEAVETQFADRYETVEPGDAVSVSRSDLELLHVVWGPSDRSMRTVTL